MCGSQGAKKINETIVDMLNKYLSDKYYIILVTGENSYEQIKESLIRIEKEKNIDLNRYVKLEKFIYDMDKMYKAVDMCITRAGAMTITELSITKKPAILIPLPSAAENHQFYNAKVLENIGGANILEQKDLSAKLLNKTILDMLQNGNIDKMSENMKNINNNDVEEKIYKCINEILKEKV